MPSLETCLHCDGTGVVDDDVYESGVGYVATEFPCDRCDGDGLNYRDYLGFCACEDCAQLPRDQRFCTEELADAAAPVPYALTDDTRSTP